MFEYMRLTIQLPSRIFLDYDKVISVVAESNKGKFGLLPNRLDCIAKLNPGILSYITVKGTEYHIAIDEGILIKEKDQVSISARNAIGDVPLNSLKNVVEEEMKKLDEREYNLRSSIARLQSSIFGSFKEVSHD